ncbi:hypothetical protein [Arthrobacter zhaoxinii]|uniref:hypothetical protein n=1 Tax=Arthrobacter zhaoxinii TaxID=2964616 RepID=UPI002107DA2C|nr:hypothetical protein [Arthrobacter zhaoxinii]MCQ2001139.1 hypothetical protein [Arthrobacter zhaoxinii]
MPSRNAFLTFAVHGLVFAVLFGAFVEPGLPFLTERYWFIPLQFLVLVLAIRAGTRRSKARFRERCEFACLLREVPGGGAGLSGRWKSAAVIPYQHRLSITGHAADRPPASHLTWDEPIEEGLVQLENPVEVSRRDPSLPEVFRFGFAYPVARYSADGAVVEIAAPSRYLDAARAVVHGTVPAASP